MAKETFYFPHDFEPMSDPKMQALVGEHGADGYAIFWRVVEMLHSDDDHRLECKLYVYAGIAQQFKLDIETVRIVLNYAITVCELFTSDGQTFWSERVFRNFEKREEIKEKKSRAGKASAEARKKAAEQAQIETPVEQNPTPVEQCLTEPNKGKEIKEKEIKVKEYKKILLSEIVISDFPSLNPEHVDIAKAFQTLFRVNLQEAGTPTTTVDRAKGTAIDDVRLMIETDKYTLEDLRDVYAFLRKDQFWKSNILSTSKLREQMPKLKLKMHNGTTANRTIGKEAATSWNQLAEILTDGFGQRD